MPLAADYTDFTTVNLYFGGKLNAGTDTTLVSALITAMSREIDTYCQQPFGLSDTDETRTWYVRGDLAFLRPPLNSVTTLSIDGTNTTTYYLDTWGADPSGSVPPYRVLWLRDYNYASWFLKAYPYPYPFYQGGMYAPARKVIITGKFGWPSVPAVVKHCCTVMVVREWQAIQAGFSDVIGVAPMGQPQFSKDLPGEIRRSLTPYKVVNL